MQISSSLHSYENAPRTHVYDRRITKSDQTENAAINRRDDAITGSKTILSSSLAEALWSMQRDAEEEAPGTSAVEKLYLSYAE